MKCISCEADINPKWTHAIDSNVCPCCGKTILPEHLKSLFSTLRDTMNNLAEYQEQLDEWMLGGHGYIRTNSDKLIDYVPKEALVDLKKIKVEKEVPEGKKFTVKVKTEHGEEEVEAEKLQSETETNDFFKRAEVIKKTQVSPNAPLTFQSPAERTQYLKKMVSQIKKVGTPSLTDPTGNSMMLSAEMLEEADPEAIAEFQQMISGGEEISSSLSNQMDDDVPAHILSANMAIARGKNNSSSNAADLLKLQQMQERQRRSREDFESGANRGKGGFSRA